MSHTPEEVIESKIKPFVGKGDWESPKSREEHYGPDQVIAAYEVGVSKGIGDALELWREKIDENTVKAGRDTRRLVEELRKRALTLNSARLKVVSSDQCEVLITLPEEEYVKEGFEDVYSFVSELENESRGEHYSIAFLFCPEVQGFDDRKVWLDGFRWRHKSLMK